MFTIRDKRDLRLAYTILHGIPDAAPEAMKALKKEIRRYNKHHANSDRRIVHEDGIDGYTALVTLPESVQSEEAAEEWFYSEEERTCAPSAYDCTGQAFTTYHKIVKRGERFFCYHQISFDV